MIAHSIVRASLSHPISHILHDVPSTLYPLMLNETI